VGGHGRRVTRHETTHAEPAQLRIGPGRSPKHRSKGGVEVASHRLDSLVGGWSSDRSLAGGKGHRETRNETRSRTPRCRRSGRVGRLQRCSKGGAEVASHWLDSLVGERSSDRSTVGGEGRRETRHETRRRTLRVLRIGPSWSLECRPKGGARVTPTGWTRPSERGLRIARRWMGKVIE
jgi:hypothetical protein